MALVDRDLLVAVYNILVDLPAIVVQYILNSIHCGMWQVLRKWRQLRE